MATERIHGAQDDGFETPSPPLRIISTRSDRFHTPDPDSGLSRALRTPRPRTRFLAKANTLWERVFRVLFGLLVAVRRTTISISKDMGKHAFQIQGANHLAQ